jgi:hypothetical protein
MSSSLLVDTGTTAGSGLSVDSLGHGYGTSSMSSLIEKKLGGTVDLDGRRAMTVPVLEPVLANTIRSHLPVLSRLAKSWSLIYSLDQHGISLNTLYTQCEKALQPKPGSLSKMGTVIVMKDAQDGIFGAWLGDGLKRGSGGYYGSGES